MTSATRTCLIDEGKAVDVVYLGLVKPLALFPTVFSWIRLLLGAWTGVWFAGWRPGCLAGRIDSDWSSIQLVAVTSGTPQDSVLGPVLTFLSTTLLKGLNTPPESSWMTPS